VINSMSVWRMAALRRIGAHNEWLGVDHVDTEYCIRADSIGLQVYLHGGHEFAQSIGHRRKYVLLGHELQSGGHSVQRRHSIGRTTMWLAFTYLPTYPAFTALCISRLLYEGLGILMVEEEKMAKLSALAAGASRNIVEASQRLRRQALSLLRRGWSLIKRLGPRARARRKLADQYLRGNGIEIGALHNPLPTSANVKYVDRLSRTELRRHYPELAAFPVVDPDIVDDGERLVKVDDSSMDFIIANHFIEHCEDPIGTLRTFAAKLRPGGTIYMAVPDKQHTFDRARPSTTFEHLQSDHADGGAASRWSHYLEFAQLAATSTVLPQAQAEALAHKQMDEHYSIHFHVWTKSEFQAFLESARETHLSQLTLIESITNGDEGIFILRRERQG
jgi:SAM-dependent methyltransferase